ncbi:MAG TPA: isochorismatase [Thermodesulfobacteriota bacterium]|jgi:nicotinamidase-related amidase|nr:isochorismatase [Thermodesulfobacteriota bacterium]
MSVERELPIPPYYNPDKVGEVWKVPYEEIARAAIGWARKFNIQPAANDEFRVCLVMVDVQNTFCIPGFELYVGGRSGMGAVEDNRRLCEFIYRNLGIITQIVPTMDTHQAVQIFHSIFLVNDKGEHPSPFTLITPEDIAKGRWRFNAALSHSIERSVDYMERYLLHYTTELKRTGKYELTIWPYHAMLGGIGHALVSAVEEAIFFHTIARMSQPDIRIKGNHPLTEHYSVLGPEVDKDQDGNPLVEKSDEFFRKLERDFDIVIIAGQAKSHCVAWTIADLLEDVMARDRHLVEKVYLLEDCTSPVVVPGVIDYTDEADNAFRRFASAGMHVVRSTDPIETWPGIRRGL